MRFYQRLLVFLVVFGAARAYTASPSTTPFQQFQAGKSPELARQACYLARWAVEQRLAGKQPQKPPFTLDKLFSKSIGVFVTIEKSGKPRGCWGTLKPREINACREIIQNAIGAATSDVRHKPLSPHELNQVTFRVSIVGPLKPVCSISELAPERLGLLVRGLGREGILLPGEAKTAHWQLAECKRQAGLRPETPVQMYVFETVLLEIPSAAEKHK